MSYEPQATIPNAPGLIRKGQANTRTTTNVGVGLGADVIKLWITGEKTAARDVTLRSTLSVAEARALRDELDDAIKRASR